MPSPRRLLPALLGLICAQAGAASADNPAVSEHAVKAVLFYKLPQFVYLPEAAQGRGPNLCGLGDHPVIAALEKLARAPTDSRAATYQTITGSAQAGPCDFLFISRGEAAGLDGILRALRGSPVVTVSDIPGFGKAGGMVEFGQNPDKAGVQIIVNRKAAQKQGIEFNAQLLRLAHIVEP